ncbi:ATP-binding protein [Shigella flexneri]
MKKEWLTLEEVVGSALQMLEPGLSSPINLSLPEPLTLIHVDGPLFERVLINLLENAVKYAGAQAEIGIDAHVEGENLQLDVWDKAPVFRQAEQTIFDKFARGNKESAVPG